MSFGPSDEEEPAGQDPGRGWVPPEARSWRHPSELHAAAFAAVFTLPRHRWRRRTAVVGAAALAAVVAGTLLLVRTGTSPSSTELDSMPVGTAAVTACCRLSPAVARGVEEMVVSIQRAGRHPVAIGCGVVVGTGLVATTTAALADARHVRVLAATGKALLATVVAVDAPSGIALLRLSAQLVPAHGISAPAATLGPGSDAMAVALRSTRQAARPVPWWTSGRVVSVSAPVGNGDAKGIAAIALSGRSGPTMPGEALLDSAGHVEGILVSARDGRRDFLPMTLVVGVANELETLGQVRHGWLGVTDTTVPGRPGAVVVWVDPKGAAAGKLTGGDEIVRVDGSAVSSSTTLRSMLYDMAPGTAVRLEALRGTRLVRTTVLLAGAP